MTTSASRLSLVGVSKSFPGIRALDNVSFDVRPGEVHGLLGENGAGKSTMLNILSAVLQATQGKIFIDGQHVTPARPADARAADSDDPPRTTAHTAAQRGTKSVPRAPADHGGGMLVDRRAQERRAREILAGLDPRIDPRAPIHTLKVAQQQIVEIARALLDDAKVIAMDEPTSSLTPSEFESLAALIARLAAQGSRSFTFRTRWTRCFGSATAPRSCATGASSTRSICRRSPRTRSSPRWSVATSCTSVT
ncbi:ATP-binding cassette domain-containing protein [Paracoccus aerius]